MELAPEDYPKRLFSCAAALTGDSELAADLVNTCYTRVLTARGDNLPGFGYFYRTLRNLIYDHFRSRKNFREVSLETVIPLKNDCADPQEAALEAERKKHVIEAMGLIAPKQREILILRHFEQLSYKEIAEVLQIPHGTVMSRLYNARKAMLSLLRERGVEPL